LENDLDESIFETCLQFYNSDKKVPFWNELAKRFNYKTGEQLRSEFKRIRKKRGIPSKNQFEKIDVENNGINKDSNDKNIENINKNLKCTTEFNKDGSITDERLIEISNEDSKTPDFLMKAHGFDESKFEMISCRNNYWEGPISGGKQVFFQSKIVVKPKKSIEISFNDIDNFFKNFNGNQSKLIQSTQYKENSDILEICLADLHIGNAGIYNKSNLNDIQDKFNVTINDICNRIKNKKLEKIYLVPLGDILHYDTSSRSTTAGTNLESTELDFATIFNMGAEMLINGIDRLSQIAPVEIPYIAGNHDRTLGYALIKSIQFYYRNNKSIIVDCDILPRKFRKIGKSLIGWCHGDMAKDKIGAWLQSEARKEWGETYFSEVHAGHFHVQQTVAEKNGTIIRYLPSMTNIDMWTYERGFVGAIKSTVSFVWDKEIGLKEMWFSNI